MDEKKINKLLKSQTKELKDDYARMGKFLLEEFEKRLQIVAEVQVDHTKKLFELGKKTDSILEMTAVNSENVEFIKNSLKRKVDIEEFEGLEKRVFFLEKKLHSI